MNKLWIDWIMCAILGAITGAYLILDWKVGIIFLLITIIFHIWRWNNWDKIYNVLGGKGVQ